MPVTLPGNAFKRLVARLPHAPINGSVEIVELKTFDAPVLLDFRAPTVSDELALPSPATKQFPCEWEDLRSDEIPVPTLRVESRVVDVEAFAPVTSEGTLFFKEQKVGRPATGGPTRTRSTLTGSRAPSRAESLLAMLLPILLPPVRTELGADPLAFPHPLYAYQGDGVRFLVEHEPGALLADDMGLGKTVQAIVALRRLFREGSTTSALIVCPKAVVTSWQRHFAAWAPELATQVIAGTPTERTTQWRAFGGRRAHVAITNFESISRDIDAVREVEIGVLVVDEMQRLKNASTDRFKDMSSLKAKRRWGLTGTPLENRIEDMATILRFLDPSVLPRRTNFVPSEVQDAARKIMLRRRKKEVLLDLPELVRSLQYVSLGPTQRRRYLEAETEGVARLRRGTYAVTHVLQLISALKQICNGVEGESAKTEWLQDYVTEADAEGERVLVFSQYVDTLHQLDTDLGSFKPKLYVGGMNALQRQRVVDSFQTPDSPERVLLMSLGAGGVGITLTNANHVVHFDSWWNPAAMSQATARAHRIGQDKTVFERTLVAENTVEERIQQILEEKRDLFGQMVDDLSTRGLSSALTQKELFGLFGLDPPVSAAAGG